MNTTQELFQRAENLKKDGAFLLEDSQLIELLTPYGEVRITGAYLVDLMAHGDIDIYVILSPFKKESVYEILNKLIEQDCFRGFYYGDYIKNPKEGFPRGYYIGLNTMHEGEFWKFDIWFVGEVDSKKEAYMKYLQENLTEESRGEILKLKTLRNERKEDISSFQIYNQVLGIGK